jgi:hypothetical protein
MRLLKAVCVTMALLARIGHASSADDVRTLTLPHSLAAGETVLIEVQVGAIVRGAEIDVTTASGQQLGVISPFGPRAGQGVKTYTIPIPPDAIRDGRIAVRLAITQYGASPRPPTVKEVLDVRLIVYASGR